MPEFFNYKTAMLHLFIKCMGDGFYNVMCKYGNIQESNLKHKISKMKKGDKSTYREILHILQNCTRAFTEGLHSDAECVYCQENASDKYYFTFRALLDKFSWACDEKEVFFYEDFCDAISNIIASEFFIESPKEIERNFATPDRDMALKNNEDENRIKEITRMFRPEYELALIDVRLNAKKTFYKWPIDEFYKQVGKEKADKIMKIVFGENDGSISTTFEKLEYETGKRAWTTFDNLFKNELNDEKLVKSFGNEEINEEILGHYQIFQSRMSAAFFLENLCAELQRFVGDSGKRNSAEIRKILALDESCKRPEDFLIPNHKEKTESYKEKVIELLYAGGSVEKITEKLNELDENCPATETVKAYIHLLNGRLHLYLTYKELHIEDFQKYLEICKKNPRYLECFSDMGIKNLDGEYSISSDLDEFLWRHEYPMMS